MIQNFVNKFVKKFYFLKKVILTKKDKDTILF